MMPFPFLWFICVTWHRSIFLSITFLSLSDLCTADASVVREVSGYVGGNVSIQCSGEWSTAGGQSYFCKSLCSSEDLLIQTWADVTHGGKYVVSRSGVDGGFAVTVMRLENRDAGRYHCASTIMSKVLYHDTYHLKVLDALAPRTSTTGPPIVTELVTRYDHPSTARYPATAVTSPPHGDHKLNQDATTRITGTMVVIIISVSLALLVCALIPVIFYGRWRSTKGPDTEKGERAEAGYKENEEEQEMGSQPGGQHVDLGPAAMTQQASI